MLSTHLILAKLLYVTIGSTPDWNTFPEIDKTRSPKLISASENVTFPSEVGPSMNEKMVGLDCVKFGAGYVTVS